MSTMKYRIEDGLRNARYNADRAFTRFYRFVLRLPAVHKLDFEYKLVPEDEETNLPHRTLDSEKLHEVINNYNSYYHETPRREYYAERLSAFLFYNPAYSWPKSIYRRIKGRVSEYALSKARVITWKTLHYVDREGQTQIDGYLEYEWKGMTFTKTLNITSIQAIRYDAMPFDKDDTSVYYLDLNTYGSYGYTNLLQTAQDTIDVRAIPKMLTDWYMDRYEFVYRHWTSTGERPVIKTEISYTDELCDSCRYHTWEECTCTDKGEV